MNVALHVVQLLNKMMTVVAMLVFCLTTSFVHADKWAVLVETSRYWHNYRHASNTLGLHRMLVKNGIPESNIILLLAHDYACDCRNAEPGTLYYAAVSRANLYGPPHLEVDYAGEAVTGELLLDLLTGQLSPYTPRRLRLATSPDSNLLIFLTGHSGVDFMKFQDFKELGADSLATALKHMHTSKGYRQLLWMADTCKAESLHQHFDMHDFLAISSSGREENSYGNGFDNNVGVINADQFSFHSTRFLNTSSAEEKTIADYVNNFHEQHMSSNVRLRADRFPRDPSQVSLAEFMAHTDEWDDVAQVIMKRPLPLDASLPLFTLKKTTPRPTQPIRSTSGGLDFGLLFWFACLGAAMPLLANKLK